MNWKRITQDELDVFLRKHKLWLADEPGGERADLTITRQEAVDY